DSDETPDRFARYCEVATKHLGDLIGVGCTINEANIAPLIQKFGFMPSLKQLQREPWWLATARAVDIAAEKLSPFQYALSDKSVEIIIKSHHKAVEAIKSAGAKFPVGITLALQDIQPVAGGE